MSDNPMSPQSPNLPPDKYRELVEKVADKVWKLWQTERRILAERNPADKRRRRL